MTSPGLTLQQIIDSDKKRCWSWSGRENEGAVYYYEQAALPFECLLAADKNILESLDTIASEYRQSAITPRNTCK